MGPKKYHSRFYSNLGMSENDFRNNNLNNLILLYVKGKQVLDIGCGSGSFLRKLKSKNFEAVGIEPNKGLVRLAKSMDNSLNIINCPAENIAINKKFDTITLLDVLEHIKDDSLQIKKLYALLKKKGRLILVVPAFSFLYGKRDINNGHYRRYSKKELCKVLEMGGFNIKKIRYWNMIGFLPYLASEKIFKKELNTSLRERSNNKFKSKINSLLNFWFNKVENRFDFHFGLSIIVIAER